MYLQINHLFLHERALTVAQKHKKLVELVLNKSLGLWSSIETMLIRWCGHFDDRLPYLCPTIFSGLATPTAEEVENVKAFLQLLKLLFSLSGILVLLLEVQIV